MKSADNITRNLRNRIGFRPMLGRAGRGHARRSHAARWLCARAGRYSAAAQE